VNGNLLPLRGASTSVGRDASADLQIDDSGLSRKHFEIVWDGKNAGLRDLGSTNGTLVNGVRTTESALPADSVITAGRTTFVFRVIAKTVSDE
jgi:pSer/pThr/pTyr-binding forkhead associated (FHA) protein